MALRKGGAKYFQTLVETSPDLLAIVRPGGQLVSASGALAQLQGKSVQALAGQPLEHLVCPDDWPRLRLALERKDELTGGAPAVPCRLVTSEGCWQPSLATILHLPGEVLGHLLLFGPGCPTASGDGAMFTQAVAQTSEIVFVTDAQGAIEYVNPAFELITGYTAEEALGQTPRILKSGNHPPEFYEKFWATILSGQTYRGMVANRKKDGSLFFEEKVVSSLVDAEG